MTISLQSLAFFSVEKEALPYERSHRMPRHASSRNKVQKPPGRQRHSQATSRVAQKGEVKGTPYSLIEWILIEKSRDINQKEWQAALRNVQELEFPRWQHPGIRTAVPRENSGQIWLFIGRYSFYVPSWHSKHIAKVYMRRMAFRGSATRSPKNRYLGSSSTDHSPND